MPRVKRKYREASEPNRDHTLQDLASQGKDVGFHPVRSGMLWKGSNVLFEFYRCRSGCRMGRARYGESDNVVERESKSR